jgi:pyruvate dehydrogenase E2 component (dihydrolipoamide acetyltransferase)
MFYDDPNESVTKLTPAEKGLSDFFLHMRGEAGACIFEVDLSRGMAFLEEQRRKDLPGLSFTHLLIKACAEVLKHRPELGYRVSRYRLVKPSSVDIGVSVAGGLGGLAPVVVIRSAEKKPLAEIMTELRREAARVRAEEKQQQEALSRFLRWIPFNWLRRVLLRIYVARHRTVRELVGTFHITNTGSLGIDIAFSPIVMATLMTVGQVKPRPMVKGGTVQIVPSAMISIQGDHRIVDGKRAADFMKDLVAVLDEPERLLA